MSDSIYVQNQYLVHLNRIWQNCKKIDPNGMEVYHWIVIFKKGKWLYATSLHPNYMGIWKLHKTSIKEDLELYINADSQLFQYYLKDTKGKGTTKLEFNPTSKNWDMDLDKLGSMEVKPYRTADVPTMKIVNKIFDHIYDKENFVKATPVWFQLETLKDLIPVKDFTICFYRHPKENVMLYLYDPDTPEFFGVFTNMRFPDYDIDKYNPQHFMTEDSNED